MRMEVVRAAVHTKKQSGIFLKDEKEKFSLLNEKRRKGRKKSRCSR